MCRLIGYKARLVSRGSKFDFPVLGSIRIGSVIVLRGISLIIKKSKY